MGSSGIVVKKSASARHRGVDRLEPLNPDATCDILKPQCKTLKENKHRNITMAMSVRDLPCERVRGDDVTSLIPNANCDILKPQCKTLKENKHRNIKMAMRVRDLHCDRVMADDATSLIPNANCDSP